MRRSEAELLGYALQAKGQRLPWMVSTAGHTGDQLLQTSGRKWSLRGQKDVGNEPADMSRDNIPGACEGDRKARSGWLEEPRGDESQEPNGQGEETQV